MKTARGGRRGGSGRLKRRSAADIEKALGAVVSLVSPLHKMGAVLFSAHMTQHEVLTVVAAPLYVSARTSNS